MAQSLNVEIQFSYGAAERVAVHTQLACSLALVALVLVQYCKDESLLEFADRFRIEDSALVHLQN